jgi:hypothetical protein
LGQIGSQYLDLDFLLVFACVLRRATSQSLERSFNRLWERSCTEPQKQLFGYPAETNTSLVVGGMRLCVYLALLHKGSALAMHGKSEMARGACFVTQGINGSRELGLFVNQGRVDSRGPMESI